MSRKPLISLYQAIRQYGFAPPDRPTFVKEGECQWCGSKINSNRRKSFCSNDCSLRFNQIVTWNRGGNAYSTRIVWRDNITCQDCGTFLAVKNEHKVFIPADRGAEVHHIIPVEKGGADNPENLITLCHDCHLTRHKALKEKENKK